MEDAFLGRAAIKKMSGWGGGRVSEWLGTSHEMPNCVSLLPTTATFLLSRLSFQQLEERRSTFPSHRTFPILRRASGKVPHCGSKGHEKMRSET